jgi:Predicted transcriptional regulators
MKNVIVKEKGACKMTSKKYILDTEIHVWRAKKRMTQQQLADLVGVSRQTIMQLENNKYNPSLMLAHTIAEILGAKIEDLFIFIDKKEVVQC